MNELQRIKNQLNKKASIWICDIIFWKEEINNSQRILEENCSKVETKEGKKKLEQFQNQVIYYRDELLGIMKHDLLHFKNELENNVNPETFIKTQKELDNRMNSIESQMKNRKIELSSFVGSL